MIENCIEELSPVCLAFEWNRWFYRQTFQSEAFDVCKLNLMNLMSKPTLSSMQHKTLNGWFGRRTMDRSTFNCFVTLFGPKCANNTYCMIYDWHFRTWKMLVSYITCHIDNKYICALAVLFVEFYTHKVGWMASTTNKYLP